MLAQLSNPDMRVPIAHALAYPERIDSGVASLDLAAIGKLFFERPDVRRFPCLELAYAALREGGTAPAILNAANEVAVEAFLGGRMRYTAIHRVIEQALQRVQAQRADSLQTVLEADAAARRAAAECVAQSMERAA
jgi:1-deoxy-D-xylulose-5-phosphate reductoisomerase